MRYMQGVSRRLAAKIAARKPISRSMSTPSSLFDSSMKKLLTSLFLPNPIRKPFNPYSSYCSRARAESKVKQSQEFSLSTSFNFKTYMHEKINAVIKALEEAVEVKEPKQLYESMRYTLLKGKKIGPMCCIAACELVGGQQSMAMPTACAVEMLHAGSLIHDDLPCMDNDDFRRGIPTNHKVYGEAVALLAGDALRTLAFEHMAIATKGVSPERIVWAMAELAKAVGPEGQTGGQILDVCSAGMSNVTLQHLEYLHLQKAAAPASGFLVAGAIVGGASSEEVEKVRKYGTCIGFLYQVIDDILDFSQDSMTSRVSYPKLIGIKKSKEFAAKLDEEAHSYLAGFDPEKVAPLISLKNYIIYREKYLL